MAPYSRALLLIACTCALTSLAAAMPADSDYTCRDDYNATVNVEMEVRELFVQKLQNVHVRWTDDSGFVQLQVFAPDWIEDIAQYIRVTKSSDVGKAELQLDITDDLMVCVYVLVPKDVTLSIITVEGNAVVELGDMDLDKLALVANNGQIVSTNAVFVEDLEMLLKGNGAISLTPTDGEGATKTLYSSLQGVGNLTYTGKAAESIVDNTGAGTTVLSHALESVDVQLSGTGNTWISSDNPALNVTGVAMMGNNVTVINAYCGVVWEDGMSECTEVVPTSSLSLAG